MKVFEIHSPHPARSFLSVPHAGRGFFAFHYLQKQDEIGKCYHEAQAVFIRCPCSKENVLSITSSSNSGGGRGYQPTSTLFAESAFLKITHCVMAGQPSGSRRRGQDENGEPLSSTVRAKGRGGGGRGGGGGGGRGGFKVAMCLMIVFFSLASIAQVSCIFRS